MSKFLRRFLRCFIVNFILIGRHGRFLRFVMLFGDGLTPFIQKFICFTHYLMLRRIFSHRTFHHVQIHFFFQTIFKKNCINSLLMCLILTFFYKRSKSLCTSCISLDFFASPSSYLNGRHHPRLRFLNFQIDKLKAIMSRDFCCVCVCVQRLFRYLNVFLIRPDIVANSAIKPLIRLKFDLYPVGPELF